MQNRFPLTRNGESCTLHRRPATLTKAFPLRRRRHREIPQQVGTRQPHPKPREETMKTRLLGALVGLAISFALPTFAQTVDPQTRQQIEAAEKNYDVAFNKNDAAAVAALFTTDAVE